MNLSDQTITAVLEWRKASRRQAKLGADNYFNHSPEKEQLFKDSTKNLKQLHKKMNELLDLAEADMLAKGERVREL